MRRPDHLPNLRKDRRAPKPDWLPRQRRGITPQMIGRYPDFDVLANAHNWDQTTRDVVLARLKVPANLRFFSAQDSPTARALCDVVVAQDSEPRVPVVELIDLKLTEGRLDGFQFDDMPDDRDTWRLVLAGLDFSARAEVQQRFGECGGAVQERLTQSFAQGELADGPWQQLNVKRAWSVCSRMILEAFYSHPWAWNEIGFGGPAYPRGFMRIGGADTREPFEQPGATDEDPVPVSEELEP